MSKSHGRGPLPFIILANTGEDVRNCINYELYYQTFQGMDIAFNEVMQAAARNDPVVLENPILWNCDDLLESNLTCLGGIDIPKVIHALRDEAEIRGVRP
ncbi:MAG: hypothetical protein A2Z14_07395 [Chloroflexi bacterium RBG_16_48_8]|nr:MAG: hypothetical protein A2Z14_07395 [Chloroflexi bacterium RBG_16_48_8]